jgi:hypothetical protein
VQSGVYLAAEQSTALLDLVGVMGFTSVRDRCEKLHFDFLGQPTSWWEHRAKVLGYSVSDLKAACIAAGKRYKNRKQVLVLLDPCELIRTAVIDLFISLGKPTEYAQNMGHTAKLFARKVPPVFDNDKDGGFDFKTPEQKQLIAIIGSPGLLEKF